MTTVPIPSYPVIYVDVRVDGSAHLNVAGRHIDYPAGPLADTRAAATRYAVQIALILGRPVRINTTDGTLTDLASAEGSSKRRRRPQPDQMQVPSTKATDIIRPPVEAAPPVPAEPAGITSPADGPHELEATHHATARAAVLTFSTGDTVTVSGSALVGRRPTPFEDEAIDELTEIHDTTHTVSKTHFRAQWHADRFWITDTDAANGVILQRHGEIAATLTVWQPHELRHGDVLLIGDVTVTVTISTTQYKRGPAHDGDDR